MSYGGGYERFALALSNQALEMGYSVDLIEAPFSLFKALAGVAGSAKRFRDLAGLPAGSTNWIRRLRDADVVYCKAEAADLILARLAVSTTKIVAGLHTPFKYPVGSSSLVRSFAYSTFPLKVILGRATLHLLHGTQLEETKDLPNATFVVENGIPEPHVLKIQRPYGQDGLSALFVGRLTDQKGVERLANLLALPSIIKLRICGDGPLREDVQLMALRDKRVDFLGWQDNSRIQAEIADSDILVVPSRWEGMPLSVIEALRIGTVVLAQNLTIMESLSKEIPGIITTDFESTERLDNSVQFIREQQLETIEIQRASARLFDATTQYGKLLSVISSLPAS